MGPGKDIECDHICTQVEDTCAAQYTVDQRNTDESAVGIDCVVPFDAVVISGAPADQEHGDQDAHNMDNCGCQERKQQPPDKLRVICNLVYGYDDERIYDHEQQIGKGLIAGLIHQFYPVTEKCEQHDEEHLHKLLKN